MEKDNKNKEKIKDKKEDLTEEEKEELEQEGELPPKKTIKKEKKQIIIVAILIAVFFASFLIPYYYIQNQRIFTYNNLTWQVEKDGDVTFYHTMFGKYYKGQPRGNHNTYLRNDPRTNDIPIEVDKPQFFNKVIISTDPQLLSCKKQILVTDALTQLTFALPFIQKVDFAVNNKTFAEKNNKDYFSCDNRPKMTTIIEVIKSNESKVTQDKDGNCYFIEIADCKDNLKVAEKFILETITELKNSAPPQQTN